MNKDQIIKALKNSKEKNSVSLSELQRYNNDRDVMKVALNVNGEFLKHLSPNLKSDKELIIIAVNQNSKALNYVDEKMLKNKSFVLALLNINTTAIFQIHDSLKNDIDVAKLVLSKDGNRIKSLGQNVQDNKELLLPYVEKNGNMLAYVSNRLKKDKHFVKKCVQESPNALYFASEEMRNEEDVVWTALQSAHYQGIDILHYIGKNLKEDKNFIVALIKFEKIYMKFVHIGESLQNDIDVVKLMVAKNGKLLSSASEKMQDNYDVVMAAMSHTPIALMYASKELQNNRDFLNSLKKRMIKKESQNKFISSLRRDELIWCKDRMEVLKSIEESEWMVNNMSKNLKKSTVNKF